MSQSSQAAKHNPNLTSIPATNTYRSSTTAFRQGNTGDEGRRWCGEHFVASPCPEATSWRLGVKGMVVCR
ncbi:hypothetical protein P8452_25078 [Trifolium repens]|nr:hypothetical protein P8452_25078 [Trifolium repens]